ncbi:MAG: succinylglutamate desuccinylase/aspartoacylase family protein [Burkholderiaceae bacterium]
MRPGCTTSPAMIRTRPTWAPSHAIAWGWRSARYRKVLRYDAFERSRQVVLAALDFVHESNLGAPIPLPRTLEVYRFRETVALPGEGPYKDAIVHESLQDRDYAPLRPGDPLLRRLDGSVINYDGDGVRHPVFVNEAAYYANGIAMMLTSLETLAVPD